MRDPHDTLEITRRALAHFTGKTTDQAPAPMSLEVDAYVDPQVLPETDRILSSLFDMRLPLTFSVEDCRHIAAIIAFCAGRTANGG